MAPKVAFDYIESWPLGVLWKLEGDVPVVSPVSSSLGTPGIFSTSSLSSSSFSSAVSTSSLSLTPAQLKSSKPQRRQRKFAGIMRSVVNLMFPFSTIDPCRMPSMPSQRESLILGRKLTGTIFGYRRGHVHFAVQEDQRSVPTLVLEFLTPTSVLVQEMASGLVKIALECEKTPNREKLYQEPIWSMFCNGRKTGHAIRRVFSEFDNCILTAVKAISMGAGVLPMDGDSNKGELMYMRARFERVIGSRDSEAFYMMSPDGHGEPELSIFLFRI